MKQKPIERYMLKFGDYLQCITYSASELKRLRCQVACTNKMREAGHPLQKIIKVRITEVK